MQMVFKGTIIHFTPSWLSYKSQLNILNKSANLIEIEMKKIQDNHLFFQQVDYLPRDVLVIVDH